MSEERGTLVLGEVHPSAHYAMQYVRSVGFIKLCQIQESMASCAIEGNRLAEVCLETWRRVQEGEPVSDRYIMGLALFIMQMVQSDEESESLEDFVKGEKIIEDFMKNRD